MLGVFSNNIRLGARPVPVYFCRSRGAGVISARSCSSPAVSRQSVCEAIAPRSRVEFSSDACVCDTYIKYWFSRLCCEHEVVFISGVVSWSQRGGGGLHL